MITVRMAMTMATMGLRIKNLDMGYGLAVRFAETMRGLTGTPSFNF